MVTNKRFQITSYNASRRRTGPSTSMNIKGQMTTVPYTAAIICYGVNGYSLRIYFIPPEYNTPANQTDLDHKIGWMFLPKEDYPFFLDLLRNEKPVYGRIFQNIPQANKLSTGPEVVGEEEGQ